MITAVREGDDGAFEELYRRYNRRIGAFVRRLVRDEARAEDVTQEAFFSALRRMRATETEIAFKPWIYEIARNAAIDLYRRTSRAEEVSISREDLMRPSDRGRLVGPGAPDAALMDKERMEHLRGALDELSETHHRILVMRELEGLSYREIGQRLELTRPAVESTLFRARRRLEREYEELEAGRRCESMRAVIARAAEGAESEADGRRLARHARRCTTCRRRARELGVEPLRRGSVAARAAAWLPLPLVLRRRAADLVSNGSGRDAAGALGPLTVSGELGTAVVERIAAFIAAAALAGAGSAVLGSMGPLEGGGIGVDHGLGPALDAGPGAVRSAPPQHATPRRQPSTPRESGATGPAPREIGGGTGGVRRPESSAPQRSAPKDDGAARPRILQRLRSAPGPAQGDEAEGPLQAGVSSISSAVPQTETPIPAAPLEALSPTGGEGTEAPAGGDDGDDLAPAAGPEANGASAAPPQAA